MPLSAVFCALLRGFFFSFKCTPCAENSGSKALSEQSFVHRIFQFTMIPETAKDPESICTIRFSISKSFTVRPQNSDKFLFSTFSLCITIHRFFINEESVKNSVNDVGFSSEGTTLLISLSARTSTSICSNRICQCFSIPEWLIGFPSSCLSGHKSFCMSLDGFSIACSAFENIIVRYRGVSCHSTHE